MSNITSTSNSRRFQNVFEAAGQAINLAPAVAAAIVESLLPALEEGETMPDFVLVQKLLSRRLALSSRELDDGDNNRKHLKNLDRHRKEVLDQASTKLRSALVDVRYILDRTMTPKEATAVFEGRSNLNRLKTPVIERVSTRLIGLLEDPKFGWEKVADPGYRSAAEFSRVRLQNALNEFLQAQAERLPEKDALVLAQGSFDRDVEEKRRDLRRQLRHLRGMYEGAGFEREAAVLAFRRRASPKKDEEKPEDPPPGKAAAAPAAALPTSPQPAAPAPAQPADPAAEAPVRRKRRRSRRSKKAPQQSVPPKA